MKSLRARHYCNSDIGPIPEFMKGTIYCYNERKDEITFGEIAKKAIILAHPEMENKSTYEMERCLYENEENLVYELCGVGRFPYYRVFIVPLRRT